MYDSGSEHEVVTKWRSHDKGMDSNNYSDSERFDIGSMSIVMWSRSSVLFELLRLTTYMRLVEGIAHSQRVAMETCTQKHMSLQ